MRRRRWGQQRGHAIVEVALMAPWVFFLFIGVFDFGFYAYALISVENAARAAALHTSSDIGSAGSSQIACDMVLLELHMMPNRDSFNATCSAAPLVVTAAAVAGVDSTGPNPVTASRVTVSYDTVPLIPIPGLLTSQLNINRTVEMRVN